MNFKVHPLIAIFIGVIVSTAICLVPPKSFLWGRTIFAYTCIGGFFAAFFSKTDKDFVNIYYGVLVGILNIIIFPLTTLFQRMKESLDLVTIILLIVLFVTSGIVGVYLFNMVKKMYLKRCEKIG